jgi:type I restriction enzyme S subunit
MAAENLLTDHLDLWTAAIKRKSSAGRGSSRKIELYGIKKLRELILQLAVRGLLVAQDPKDEPASELLTKIAAEKAKLVKAGIIKKDRPQPPIAAQERPFKVPVSWQLVRFGDLLISRDSERIPLSADERATRRGDYDYYGASGIIDSIDAYLFDKPLLLIGEDGANLINRSTPIAFVAYGRYWVNNHAHVLDGYSEELLLYVCMHINAISLEPYVTGTAQPKMNQAKMNGIVLAIPPLAEQRRIVAKVDELLAVCDQLERQTDASLSAHQILVETLLHALTSAADHAHLASAWQRIAEHFNSLFTTEESIDQLEQAILEMAVMGKLASQDINDESASELLKNIAAERAKLLKQGKIRKESPVSPILKEEREFDVPMGWEWCRLSQATECEREISYGIIKLEAEPKSGGVPTLRCSDVKPGYIRTADVRTVASEIEEPYKRTRLRGGEVLVNIRGTLGGAALVPNELVGYNIAREVAMVPIHSSMAGRYFVLLILSPFFWKKIESNLKGIAYKGLSLEVLSQFAIPVPPLNEQHRIVAKVEELMGLCHQLKMRLRDAQTTQLQLGKALTKQALAEA